MIPVGDDVTDCVGCLDVFFDAGAKPRVANGFRDGDKGFQHHVDGEMVPLVEGLTQLPFHQLEQGCFTVKRKFTLPIEFMPGQLIDQNHRSLHFAAVERLP